MLYIYVTSWHSTPGTRRQGYWKDPKNGKLFHSEPGREPKNYSIMRLVEILKFSNKSKKKLCDIIEKNHFCLRFGIIRKIYLKIFFQGELKRLEKGVLAKTHTFFWTPSSPHPTQTHTPKPWEHYNFKFFFARTTAMSPCSNLCLFFVFFTSHS